MSTDSLLIDRYCQRYDFTRIEYRRVAAPAPVAMESMRSLDLLTIRSRLASLATAVRSVPERLGREPPPDPPTMRLGDLFDQSPDESAVPEWIGLEEERGSQLVFGAVGRFWEPQITWRSVPADRFVSFNEPGWGKIVASIASHPYGDDSAILSYEARTVLYDEESRRRFRRYWTVIAPFAGLIMRSALRTVAENQAAINLEAGASHPRAV